MKILNLKRTNYQRLIKEAVKALKAGELVIYPTETCYGAGVDATNQKAVDKLLSYKRRREGRAISVAVANQEMAEKYIALNETAKNLYQNFLPGPLTVISRSKGMVVKDLEAENGTLGIRIPNYPLALNLVKRFGRPITATSANVSGGKTPYCLGDILKDARPKQQALIDLFLDAGRLPPNPPSTVVNTLLNEPRVLRQGEIEISEKAGQVFISKSEEETKKIAAKILNSQFACLPARQAIRNSQTLIFALQGELGSGKTQFAKGIGKTLGIKTNISSPTFILVKEYNFRLSEQTKGDIRRTFYHIDAWRMQEGKELLEIGLEKMLKPGNILTIEWLQKVKPILEEISKKQKAKVVWVEIETLSPTKRKIKYQI